MTSIWISALDKSPEAVGQTIALLKKYGLPANGHFWNKDNQKMGWLEGRDALLDPRTALWVILGRAAALKDADIRYGLSWLALCLQAHRGLGFPIVVLLTGDDPAAAAPLPTPLQRALVLPAANPATPAKLVAKVHAKPLDLPAAWYLDMVGNEQIGQWVELRPTHAVWPGVLFGVNGGGIAFQAVGPSGRLPRTSTLNYPMQGLKLELGGAEYTAWAARNEISDQNAYFVKITGCPTSLLFGPYSEEAETDLYVLGLQ